MSKKENDLNALFADALKAVENIGSKDESQKNTASNKMNTDMEIEIDLEDSIEATIPETMETEIDIDIEIEIDDSELDEENLDASEADVQNRLEKLNHSYAALREEHDVLEDKCRRAIRSLRKYKREDEQSKKHNEMLRREISRLQVVLKQNERKIEIQESRQESSREALQAANQRIDQLMEAMKQQEAQIERSKKLRQKEQEQATKFGAAPSITKLLPAIDSIELALAQSSDNVEAFQEGLRIALNQFQGTLESIGVSKIQSSKGTAFDPNYHEAVMRIPSEEVSPNHILECFCEAYVLNGRLLRAAKVSVAMPM